MNGSGVCTSMRCMYFPSSKALGNLTIGIHSSSGEFLREETSNIKIHFVGRFAVGSASVSKTVFLDKDIYRRHVKLTKVDANRWETLAS
ncbi:unnamed protein product, partial [Porites evermanni]